MGTSHAYGNCLHVFLALGAYVTLDSATVLATSFMLPHHRLGSIALAVEGFVGIAIGVVFFLLASKTEQISWFAYLAAVQARCVAIAEFIVAHGTSPYHDSRWCYASRIIAVISSAVLLLNRRSHDRQLGLLVHAYPASFGLNLFGPGGAHALQGIQPANSAS